MLETFGYLEELHQAVLACRDVNPKMPIVAQVTIDEDGNCLDGATPRRSRPPAEWNVDVLHHCSVGPVANARRIERVRAVTSLPLAAATECRHAALGRRTKHLSLFAGIYGELHAKFVAAGVQLIGGCCGTTPDHIRAMKSALRVREARGKTAISEAIHTGVAPSAPASIPIAERSRLAQELRLGNL